MDNFKYKVSVIVPVYNVSEYLRDCLDSLLAQTIDQNQMEVLLINDGSTDNSLDICYEYAQSHFIFKVFTKENEGLSATRNYGINRAHGKYLIYLDSDDKFSPETIKNVTDFFDEHYDEIDSVTFPIVKYDSKWKLQEFNHFRYKYLNKTGVYDVNEFPYITQTTINICTKNKNNVEFDTTKSFRHEDQKYNNDVLSEHFMIGFVKEAEYMYYQHEGSIMKTFANPIELWETTIAYYENMFAKYDEVPRYYQAMFIHDCNWKLRDNILFPYHYDEKQFEEAMRRFSKLMDKIDDDIIINHPNIDKFHKYYFLSFKSEPIIFYADNSDYKLLKENAVIYQEKSTEIIVRRFRFLDNEFRFYGSIKSPVFSFLGKPQLYAIVNESNKIQMELSLSGSSWYKSHTQTNTFWAFTFKYDNKEINSLRFVIVMDGKEYSCRYWFSGMSPFSSGIKLTHYISEGYDICFKQNKFSIKKAESVDYISVENEMKKIAGAEVSEKRKIYKNEVANREIWLYYDNFTVEYDNGYLQFINDFEHDDGVDRYYVYEKEFSEVEHLFEQKHYPYLIRFGSEKHKALYINSNKIFTSFIEHFSITPFKSNEEKYYLDMYNAEVYYLQHGVLHAKIPWYYTAEMVEADKVIVSTYFEYENMQENCGYNKDDLLKTGMPRYDRIDRNRDAENRIIFAPSWRDYLIGKFNDSGERRENLDQKLLNSNYYKNIVSFVSNPKLHEYLIEHDLYLDLKLHPNFFTAYRHLIDFNYDHIQIAENKVDLTKYKMFITDFSSFVFDYAYISRPIMYFVPDYLEFKAGMNRYRELFLPFNKAFGNLVTTPEDAVNEFIRIANNDFVPDPEFKNRMDNFYVPMDNCCESLYNLIMNK